MGLRLGWLVGPEPVVDRLADIKMQTDYGVSALTQQVTEELLNSGLYYQGIDSVRKQLRKRRDLMLNLLGEFFSDLAEWNRPAGGFFIWVSLKNQVSAERVFNLALKERLLVLTAYCGDTYADHGKLQAFFEFTSMMGECWTWTWWASPPMTAGRLPPPRS